MSPPSSNIVDSLTGNIIDSFIGNMVETFCVFLEPRF